jgi:hypothetical protein
MFAKLTEELLDLVVREKGYRLALYAARSSCDACSSNSSSSLTCCKL